MFENKKVMILGAAGLMVPTIQHLKQYGIKTVVIDGNPRAKGLEIADYPYPIDFQDVDALVKIGKKLDINGIMPLSDSGVLPASKAANELGLVHIPFEIAKKSINKIEMRKIWKENNLPIPKFMIISDASKAISFAEDVGYPIIIKPPESMASRGVVRIENENELIKHFQETMDFSKDKKMLVEEYITGDECSVESITFDSKTYVFGISDKIKLPPPYRVDKSVIYPTKHNENIIEKIIDVTKGAIESFPLSFSATHIELTVRNDSVYLFEIGPRIGGAGVLPSLCIPNAYGIDMMKYVMAFYFGEEKHLKELSSIKFKSIGGSVLQFITPSPGKVKNINWDLDDMRKNVLISDLFIKPGDTIKEVKSGGDRSGYIITRGDNREEAIQMANDGEIRLKIDRYPQV